LTANNELTHFMELNALILDSVGEGVYGIDKNGSTTFSNPAAEKITGWTKQDLMDKNSHSVWHHSHADGHHYPAEDCPIYAALHDGLIHHEQEEVFWRKDGSSFPVEYTSTPMMNGRKIVGAVVVFKDISQRKKHEESLKSALSKVTQLQKQFEAENSYLKDELTLTHHYDHIIGNHPSLLKVLDEVGQVAPTDASVLINGETGTGKELIARAVHCGSNRRDRPLIKVNCGAISENLVESELFGHEKGAFTGAISSRAGRFEMANGGTLFLDEIGDMPLPMQVKMLRVLQERSFERVGGTKTIKVDVRIVAATHRHLETMVEIGDFREDLFYRLNVYPIEVPSLRDRKSDIAILLKAFTERAVEQGLGRLKFHLSAIDSLERHAWDGNVRELLNLIERLAIMYPEGVIGVSELPLKFRHVSEPDPSRYQVQNDMHLDDDVHFISALQDVSLEKHNAIFTLPDQGFNLKVHIETLETSLIEQALAKTNQVVARAATLLGIRRTTLVEKMRKYGVQRK
jgi:PAS domain S-box-containing protein